MERITRSILQPLRKGLTWDERWKGPDAGLIACWEAGRELARRDRGRARGPDEPPATYERAEAGELVVLPWKGGAERTLKGLHKYGPLNYLAMWQGLRDDDLDIDPATEVTLTCSRTGMQFTYTSDATKYVVKEEAASE